MAMHNPNNLGPVAFAGWLLLLCVAIASVSASAVLLKDGSVQANSQWGYVAFIGRWAAFGVGLWVVALVGGAVSRVFLKDGARPEVVRRAYALGVASAVVLADLLLLLLRQLNPAAAVWGIALAVLVATAAYLLFPARARSSRASSR